MSLKERWESDDQMFYYAGLKEKIIPMIIGGAVGEILGVLVKGRKRDSFKIEDRIGSETSQLTRNYSEPTLLTMCIIQSIIAEETEEELLKRYSNIMEKRYEFSAGEVFDIETTARQDVKLYKEEYGNSLLIRNSPLVALLSKTFDANKKITKIKNICQITHAHPRFILACIIYIQFMIMLYNNNSKIEAYDGTINWIKKNIKNSEYLKEFIHYSRIIENRVYDYERAAIQSDSYVVHTLEAAIWCFFQHDNYKDSIIEAVNLGGDTNRIAFITGTMAGLYYKIDSIPQDWTKNLVELENIEHICEEYCKFFVKKEYGNKTNYERLNMKKISHSICIPLV